MTKEQTVIWAGPRFSPDGKKGVSLHQNANELILQVTTEQGYSSLVLEPIRDLATLVEAVRLLVVQVSGRKKMDREGDGRFIITQMVNDLHDIAEEDQTTFERSALKKMLKFLNLDSELLFPDYPKKRRKGASKKG